MLDPDSISTESAEAKTAADPTKAAEPLILAGKPGEAPERRRLYLHLHLKLLLVISIALGWAGLSLWLAIPWIDELSQSITLPGAVAVIMGIAIIPGYLNAEALRT